ncbi:hypothetical protein KFK09_012610 [Dendrobium nobile]|uniref:RING-type E3 ubiquitin transferase n=1 Tax=Dendrobium nobile TaxID=94219 RepID=A0A8T3BG06_DENNO|nr:hypothetical protein KFK09_012610 [Dendrobium nobile]
MADATMTTSHMCYTCRQRVNPVLEPELKCPFCDCGFVKEIAGREATESEDAGSGNESDTQASKKKRAKKMLTITGQGHQVSPSTSPILEDDLKHQYVGCRRIEELKLQYMNYEIELTKVLDDWNDEFVKVKYLQEEYKKMYDDKINEMKSMEEQLIECRADMAIMKASASLHNQQMNRLHIKLVDTQTMINQYVKDQQILEEKIAAIENENERLQSLLSEKEAKFKSEQSFSRVIEEFKKSIAFKMIVQDEVQKARDHIYDVEVKALELERMEEGFIRGFLKGVRLVQRKTGVEVEGLTPSQASGASSSDSDDDEIENL